MPWTVALPARAPGGGESEAGTESGRRAERAERALPCPSGPGRRPRSCNRRDLPADEDPGRAVAQRVQVPSGPLDRLPGARQHHPQLRVRCQHLVVRHSEETPVEEPLPAVADQAFVRAGEPTGTGEPAYRPVPPAVAVDNRLLNDLPLTEKAPEVLVRPDAAGHAVAVSDYRHRDLRPRRMRGRVAEIARHDPSYSLAPSAIITSVGRMKRMNAADRTKPPTMLTTNGTRNIRSSPRS